MDTSGTVGLIFIAAIFLGLYLLWRRIGRRADAKLKAFISSQGMKPDYEWKCAGDAVAIDTNRSKIVIKVMGKAPYTYNLEDVRNYKYECIERSNGGKVWQEQFNVAFSMKDIKNPTIKVRTATRKLTDQLMETLTQAFERSNETVN